MRLSDTTRRGSGSIRAFGKRPSLPGLLVAFAPPGATGDNRFEIGQTFVAGRNSGSDLQIRDDKISRRHFRIRRDGYQFWIEDLGSVNGTYVQGNRLYGNQQLSSPSVIRVGDAVLVFQADIGALMDRAAAGNHGFAGPFFSGPIIQSLREASNSSRHILLVGPSGTGKELAAQTLCSLMSNRPEPMVMVAHNAARFSSSEEATTTLFGVGQRVFSSVDARPGLIEQAAGGVLFLDETHNLPPRVQRSLLRVIEDGQFERIGESQTRDASDVRFILASNAPAPTHELAPDLLARLRVVALPALSERVADIPEIFHRLLTKALRNSGHGVDELLPLFVGDHYEAMCLDGFENQNVRAIGDLVDRLVTRLTTGVDATDAIATVFEERFAHNPVSLRCNSSDSDSVAEKRPHYERYKDQITAMFRECEGNLSAVERRLRASGIVTSRRCLASYLNRWGVRPR